jgi:hypothetical protein
VSKLLAGAAQQEQQDTGKYILLAVGLQIYRPDEVIDF